jgi:hypothetical protein
MNGTLAKLMAQMDPKLYRKEYLVDKKGRKCYTYVYRRCSMV